MLSLQVQKNAGTQRISFFADRTYHRHCKRDIIKQCLRVSYIRDIARNVKKLH